MRPLRFCLLTTFYPPWSFGGDAIEVERLARVLAERGHSVTVIHAPAAYRALHGSPTEAADTSTGIEVVGVDSRGGRVSVLTTHLTGRPFLTRGKIERVLARGFDVIHFHNPSLLGGPALLGLGNGIKLYTAHEQWLLCPTHVLWKYKRRICDGPQCWRCSLTYGRPPQLWRSTDLLRRSLTHLDALIAPSRSSARLHARFTDIVRIEQLPHFVPDVDGPAAPLSRSDPAKPYFLYVGRLEPLKGVDVLLRTFRRRSSEELLIAGTGSLERSLRREAADLPHVHFLGQVGQDGLDGLYRRALAVVVPTKGHESFGLVPVEAFARGTPVVVHRVGALAELIEESEGGLAYSSDQELDQSLDRLASDPTLRRTLGELGRSAYLERWTASVHLRRYFGLIAELAAARGDRELSEAATLAAT